MSSDPLESLLEQINRGDPAATEQIILAYEPYLRKVVRRLLPAGLRSRFDSVDVVQSVWSDLLEKLRTANWNFPDVAHLRAFLVRITRNRFVDRARQHQSSQTREKLLFRGEQSGVSAGPRPSEVAQAEDLWSRMLALCSPEHQQVLRLKREGLSLEEIAAQTGLHIGSIRRILRTLARRLALEDPCAQEPA
jgi:RNA polymerase sigma-70 factor (ECF subfamily)